MAKIDTPPLAVLVSVMNDAVENIDEYRNIMALLKEACGGDFLEAVPNPDYDLHALEAAPIDMPALEECEPITDDMPALEECEPITDDMPALEECEPITDDDDDDDDMPALEAPIDEMMAFNLLQRPSFKNEKEL